MYYESQVDIYKVSTKKLNEKRRHLRVRHNYIRKLIIYGLILLTDQQTIE